MKVRGFLQAGALSVWAPASLEGEHVGNAGVGMVCLRGAPVLPTVATVGFLSEFFQLGRVLRCHLPVAGGRVVHLVVVFGFEGASTDLEKFRLTEKLLDAVLCELAVVASGQPFLIVGDLNIEPEKIPCLLKVFMAGHLFDLQSSWAAASGVAPLPTCCRSSGSCGGSRRDFVLGCPLAASALRWCTVLQDRWVLHHYAVRASFSVGRWSARACLPVGFLFSGLPLGLPALIGPGVLSLSRFVVFGRCMMNICCQFILPFGRVSVLLFWLVMFLLLGVFGRFRAEVSLVRLWLAGFALILALGTVRLSIFSRMSLSPRVIILRRWLGCVPSVLTLSRDLELGVQLDAVVAAGPCGPLSSANLAISPAVGLPFFGNHVRVLLDAVVDFLHKVVVHRRDVPVRDWRSWMLEDDKVHPYRWLKPFCGSCALSVS